MIYVGFSKTTYRLHMPYGEHYPYVRRKFDRTELVFIGRNIGAEREAIVNALKKCEV